MVVMSLSSLKMLMAVFVVMLMVVFMVFVSVLMVVYVMVFLVMMCMAPVMLVLSEYSTFFLKFRMLNMLLCFNYCN